MKMPISFCENVSSDCAQIFPTFFVEFTMLTALQLTYNLTLFCGIPQIQGPIQIICCDSKSLLDHLRSTLDSKLQDLSPMPSSLLRSKH